MEADYWLNAWKEKDTQFHQEGPNHFLIKYFSHAAPSNVLVPLCGKTLDMAWLASQKHKVLGVELSPIACKEFFTENKVPYTEEKMKDGILFKSDRVSIFCGDFFQLPPSLWKNISTIYDRAALIALPPTLRDRYAECILKNWKPPSRESFYILITGEAASGDTEGPPFSVPLIEVERLFSSALDIALLASLENKSHASKRILKENALLLTLK